MSESDPKSNLHPASTPQPAQARGFEGCDHPPVQLIPTWFMGNFRVNPQEAA